MKEERPTWCVFVSFFRVISWIDLLAELESRSTKLHEKKTRKYTNESHLIALFELKPEFRKR